MVKITKHHIALLLGLSLSLAVLPSALAQTWQNNAPMLTDIGLANQPYADVIIAGEMAASEPAKKVLLQARTMMAQGELIKGGCWDYLNTAWNRAGYPERQRKIIYKGEYKVEPYANIEQIQAGDWLYYVNYSYNEIEHSGMFVDWLDKDRRIGLIFSYAGENRPEPARYRPYDLSGVYRIIRASD